MINAGIQPIQNLSVLTKVGEWCENKDKKAEWAKYWIHKGFVGGYQICFIAVVWTRGSTEL